MKNTRTEYLALKELLYYVCRCSWVREVVTSTTRVQDWTAMMASRLGRLAEQRHLSDR